MHGYSEPFFRLFERYSNSIDVDGFASQFAESFLAGGPNGSQSVRTSDFLRFLPIRQKALAALGSSTAHLVSLSEIALGELYLFVTTQWQIDTAVATPEGPICVASSFLIEKRAEGWRIVAYIAHNDLESLLKQRLDRAASE